MLCFKLLTSTMTAVVALTFGKMIYSFSRISSHTQRQTFVLWYCIGSTKHFRPLFSLLPINHFFSCQYKIALIPSCGYFVQRNLSVHKRRWILYLKLEQRRLYVHFSHNTKIVTYTNCICFLFTKKHIQIET